MPRILQVILPSYDEEIALGRLFPQFEELNRRITDSVRVLVVDDGSRDRTPDVARSWMGVVPVSLVQFEQNRGYGAALEAGVTHAAQSLSETDLIATMDADDTHSPAYLEAMIRKLESEGLDVVIASRFAPGGKEEGVSLDRRILSRGASGLYRRVFRLPAVTDYSCGYRLFRASLIRKSLAESGSLGLESGFQATGELLLRLREQTSKFGEIGFELHYERKPTKSKMQKIQTILGTLRFLGRVRKALQDR